jgi:Na+/H+ antiporter NhaD/arsenite permease-like protein
MEFGAIQWLMVAILVLILTLAALEGKRIADKAAVALLGSVILWIIRAKFVDGDYHDDLVHMESEIFGLFMFLFAAMFLVEVLRAARFFDTIQTRLARRNLTDRPQFMFIMVLTFFLSAVLDNLTVTIVMVELAFMFFNGRNRMITVAGVVIMANAGGAWSFIGDVTTLMIWVDGKFTPWEIVSQGLLPALALGGVSSYLLLRKLEPDTVDVSAPPVTLSGREKVTIAVALSCFALPLVANLIGLPPYFGLMAGLGMTWLLVHALNHKHAAGGESQLDVDILKMFTKVEYPALLFLVGVLGAIAALSSAGVLESVIALLDGQSFGVMAAGMSGLGLLSAIVDNVPLTAVVLDVVQVVDPALWVLLALSVGTGGSILVFGSAAGVVAMQKEKGLTFATYLRLASGSALAGYAVCMGTWVAQYTLLQLL